MRLLNRLRNSKGFTMAETLLTVAILIIVMAVVSINVVSYQKTLQQKALDDKAQVIYLAAQNQLSSLKSNGLAEVFSLSSDADHSDVGKLTWNGDESPFGKGSLCYVSSEKRDNASVSVLNLASVDDELLGHKWVVIYNPKTASVGGVFYCEGDTAPFLNSTGDLVMTQASDLVNYDSRVKKAEVGYFGSGAINANNSGTLTAHVMVNNAEKLTATFSATYDEGGASSPAYSVSYRYWLTQKIGDREYRSKDKTVDAQAAVSDTTVVLDGLDEDESFASQFSQVEGEAADSSSNLVPGAPFEIHVTAQVVGSAESAEATDGLWHSSLFDDDSTFDFDSDNRPGDDAGSQAAGSSNGKAANGKASGESEPTYQQGTAVVSNGRHLQNLDTETSQVSDKVVHAVQKNDILLAGDDSEYASTYTTSSGKPRVFVPIENKKLESFTGLAPQTQGTADGQAGKSGQPNSQAEGESQGQTKIVGLVSQGTRSNPNAGLFDTFYGNELSHVWLEDATATSNIAGSYAGSLAAKVSRATTADQKVTTQNRTVEITDCRSYLSENALKTESGQSLKKKDGYQSVDTCVSAKKAAGGLVGYAEKYVSVDGSFAAGVVKGAERVGGLIGEVKDASLTLSKSYADSYLTGSVSTGGLIGWAHTADSSLVIPESEQSLSLDSVYASGYQSSKKDGIEAGLMYDRGFRAPVDIKSSYAACFFTGNLGDDGKVYEVSACDKSSSATRATTTFGVGKDKSRVMYSNQNHTDAAALVQLQAFKDGKKEETNVPVGVTTKELKSGKRNDQALFPNTDFVLPSEGGSQAADRIISYQLDGQVVEGSGDDNVRYAFPVLSSLPHYGDRGPNDVYRLTLLKSEANGSDTKDHIVSELLVTNGGKRANGYPSELLDDEGNAIDVDLQGWYTTNDGKGDKVLDPANDKGKNGGVISSDAKNVKDFTHDGVFKLDRDQKLYAGWKEIVYQAAEVKATSPLKAGKEYLLVKGTSGNMANMLYQSGSATSAKLGIEQVKLEDVGSLKNVIRASEIAKITGEKKIDQALWVSDSSGSMADLINPDNGFRVVYKSSGLRLYNLLEPPSAIGATDAELAAFNQKLEDYKANTEAYEASEQLVFK